MYQLNVSKIENSLFLIKSITPDNADEEARFYYNEDVRIKLLKWKLELETTNLLQGKGLLHNVHNNSYCCLGILGRLNHIKGSLSKNFLSDADMMLCLQYDMNNILQKFFSYLNDEADFSFLQIAGMIGEFVEKLDTRNSFSIEG